MHHKLGLRGSIAIVALAGLTAGGALAQTPAPSTPPEPDWTFSGNLGLFSEYVFRGIEQTNNKPAVQGGLDLVRDAVGETDALFQPELSWTGRKTMDTKVEFILTGLKQHWPEF